MAGKVKVKVEGDIGFCSTDIGAGEECGIAEGTGVIETVVASSATGTALVVKGDFYTGYAGGIEGDPTDVSPIQVVATGGNGYRTNLGAIFVPLVLQYKREKVELKGKMVDGKVRPPSLVLKNKGKGREGDGTTTYFIPYITAGSIPVEPSREGLTPPDHPFGGVPINGDVPALLAVRAGLENIPLGDFVLLNAEVGKGIKGGSAGLDLFGNPVSSTGLSVLISGRASNIISDWIGVRWGLQYTKKDAPEEPELNKFFEGSGETEVWPAYYLVFELGAFELYLGDIQKRIHIDQYPSGDSNNPIADVDRFRRYRYIGVGTKLPGEIDAVLTHGTQTFSEEDPDRSRGRATGTLTSLKLSRDLGDLVPGLSVEGTFFVQTADGERAVAEQMVPEEGQMLEMEGVDHRASGGLLTVSWSWERALEMWK